MFGAASAWAAYAGGVDGLIAARAVMGAGAAFIMPATLSLLISVFADTRERATAIGIWAATAGLGVALGPVVGGFLLDHFWWGSIFIVNVPLVAIALVAGRRLLPESRDPVARRIDWTGAALSGVGLVAFVWAIIEAPSKGWTSAPVLAAGALAAVALVAFVVWQRRVDEPLLDVRLFANPRFTAASSTVMVLFFALFGFLFLSTQYLQFVLGYSPSAAGVRVLPYAAAMIVFAPLSSKLVARLGTKRVVTAGMLLFSAGLAVAATVTTSSGYGRLAIALRLHGRRHGARGSSGDRVDHGLAAAGAGEHRVRRQRHDARARRRARRRHRRQHHVLALRVRAPRRRPRGGAANRSAPPSRPGAASRTPRARRSSTRCRARRSSSPSWPRSAPSSPGATSPPARPPPSPTGRSSRPAPNP